MVGMSVYQWVAYLAGNSVDSTVDKSALRPADKKAAQMVD